MVNTINPADCKPGEVYEGTVDGERLALFRRSSVDAYPWESLYQLHDHADVSDLVRLVPARPVTRDDLPSDADIPAMGSDRIFGVIPTLDAVVEHLNAKGGVPASDARWRRAHEIVEAERDQARRERDEALRKKGEAFDRAVRAERERDEWKARAEAAEELAAHD